VKIPSINASPEVQRVQLCQLSIISEGKKRAKSSEEAGANYKQWTF